MTNSCRALAWRAGDEFTHECGRRAKGERVVQDRGRVDTVPVCGIHLRPRVIKIRWSA